MIRASIATLQKRVQWGYVVRMSRPAVVIPSVSVTRAWRHHPSHMAGRGYHTGSVHVNWIVRDVYKSAGWNEKIILLLRTQWGQSMACLIVSLKVFGCASSGGSTVKKLGFDCEASKNWTKSKQATDLTGEQKELMSVVSFTPRTLWPGERVPRTHWIGVWVVSRNGLGFWRKEKALVPAENRTTTRRSSTSETPIVFCPVPAPAWGFFKKS
jgi:hypothetical protein